MAAGLKRTQLGGPIVWISKAGEGEVDQAVAGVFVQVSRRRSGGTLGSSPVAGIEVRVVREISGIRCNVARWFLSTVAEQEFLHLRRQEAARLRIQR